MKFWLLDYHPAHARWEFEDMEDFERLAFDGQPMLASWIPPRLKCASSKKPTDFLMRHNGALLVTEKAAKLFQRHLRHGEAEFLPVEHKGETLYFVHVLNIPDCLDVPNCLEERIGDTLTGYKQYAFHERLAAPHGILRIRLHEGDRLVNYPFVGDTLQAAISESDLAGYQLLEMWDSACSWQQKEADFEAMVEASDRARTKNFDFGAASPYMKKKGMTVYSGKWAMRHDPEKGLLIGDLLGDGTYSWIDPMFIPPILLGLTWGIKDPEPSPSGMLGKIAGVFAGGRKKA
ncbi:hypothetical protein GZH47_19715 [Paenibacillus rhizovicinus]|uniref:Uncharacterized protein n=1 Tax=Paenibacillus rhizovicinus TaxID=2704463 RepID=A0A6C0P3H3_9BACL|nr:hypothetical protein [Paenibacillus rhizovicinus]QHW32816.1 hypothetical protein GZH47_19715 [Paenibacillus rhizovicinus]